MMARPRLNGMERTATGRISRSRASLKHRGLLTHDGWVVYFARGSARTKIGFSGATRNRIAWLSTDQGGPVRVVALAHLPNEALARKLEAKMHEVFAAKRIEGEWFDLKMSDVLAAMAMCRKIGIKVSGGADAGSDVPILSGIAYGADHSVA